MACKHPSCGVLPWCRGVHCSLVHCAFRDMGAETVQMGSGRGPEQTAEAERWEKVARAKGYWRRVRDRSASGQASCGEGTSNIGIRWGRSVSDTSMWKAQLWPGGVHWIGPQRVWGALDTHGNGAGAASLTNLCAAFLGPSAEEEGGLERAFAMLLPSQMLVTPARGESPSRSSR